MAVGILTVESGGARRRRLGQAEQVVVGVELTHVADGFTLRDVPWRTETEEVQICNIFWTLDIKERLFIVCSYIYIS